jgi:peptide deformylase
MPYKKIIMAGDKRLRARNRKIKDIKSAKTQRLIKELIKSMRKEDLIGIAANQIGENYSVFITQPRSTKARKGVTDKLRVYINPKLTYTSKSQNLIYEGCGSVGDIFGPVLRPKEVEVEALDEKGQKFSLRADGILARVILHELDHLSGVEFLQKVSDYSKIMVKEHYVKQIRNSKLQKQNSQITKVEFKKI